MTTRAQDNNILVYVTVGSAEEARSIAHAVVESRFAACANVLPQMTSVYRWNGSVISDAECVLLLKTLKSQYEPLERLVREMHSYDVPCIVSLPLTNGFEPFLKWIRDQTQS